MTREAGINLPRLEVCLWWRSKKAEEAGSSRRCAKKDKVEEGERRVAAAKGPHQQSLVMLT